MRALIRNQEIYAESNWSEFTKTHLDWHTTIPPGGDGYALAEDAPEDAIPSDFDITTIEVPDTAAPAEEDGTAEVPTVTRRVAVFNTARYEARKAQDGAEDVPAPETPAEGGEGASGEPPDTIIIDGVEYTRAVGE